MRSPFRFEVGALVLCNMGPSGWRLGRIIALDYREDHWPAERTAPYQVLLEADRTLIYVPEDDARYCREATREDLRIARRMDALAELPEGSDRTDPLPERELSGTSARLALGCRGGVVAPGSARYRGGGCHSCDCCPRSWSHVELLSEHYRCAARNGLRVTRCAVDLGTVRVRDVLHHPAGVTPSRSGFMQSPTLARLPPGVRFSDDGSLRGEVRFDPHRDAAYRVEFVAASTADWEDPTIGIVRLEITFTVEGNEPPEGFDVSAFGREQQRAHTEASGIVGALVNAWELWEQGSLSNRATCDRMGAELLRLRELLELHPRLDGGRWWAQLGGFHMNAHKLLENTLFECELYLGHALTFGDAEVRQLAEQNLEGCYQKRLLETARFLWMDGVEKMLRGEWAAAAETLRLAAAQKDGWGWAVNYGDIWISEAAARLVHGAEIESRDGAEDGDAAWWITESARLLAMGVARADASGDFGPEGHPWASELGAALRSYRRVRDSGADTTGWLKELKQRTATWCAWALGGAAPFPPKPRPRREDASALVRRMPGHNA